MNEIKIMKGQPFRIKLLFTGIKSSWWQLFYFLSWAAAALLALLVYYVAGDE